MRTKKELSKLLRALDPLPDLPARIEPLVPAPARSATTTPSWADFVESLSPVVRELAPGDAPRDWMNDDLPVAGAEQHAAGAAHDEGCATGSRNDEQAAGAASGGRLWPRSGNDDELPALARSDAAAVTGPLRYGVQFSAEEEYVQLVERAKALLSHGHSRSTLEEIHLRALRLLVADLERRRFGKAARAQRDAAQGRAPMPESSQSSASGQSEQSEQSEPRAARPRGRYIPAAVRREVFERDTARCTFVDSAGQRCREAHCLELHHLQAFAQGGGHHSSNLTLLCRAHNALAAEEDFGCNFLERKRARGHEPFGSG